MKTEWNVKRVACSLQWLRKLVQLHGSTWPIWISMDAWLQLKRNENWCPLWAGYRSMSRSERGGAQVSAPLLLRPVTRGGIWRRSPRSAENKTAFPNWVIAAGSFLRTPPCTMYAAAGPAEDASWAIGKFGARAQVFGRIRQIGDEPRLNQPGHNGRPIFGRDQTVQEPCCRLLMGFSGRATRREAPQRLQG